MKSLLQKTIIASFAFVIFLALEARAQETKLDAVAFSFSGYTLDQSFEDLLKKLPQNAQILTSLSTKSKKIRYSPRKRSKEAFIDMNLPPTVIKMLTTKLSYKFAKSGIDKIRIALSERETTMLANQGILFDDLRVSIYPESAFYQYEYVTLQNSEPMPLYIAFTPHYNVSKEIPSVFKERYGEPQECRLGNSIFWQSKDTLAIYNRPQGFNNTGWLAFLNIKLFGEIIEIISDVKKTAAEEELKVQEEKRNSIRDSI